MSIREMLMQMGAIAGDDSDVPIVTGAHRYWRLYITATEGVSYINIAEINFRVTLGVQMAMTGTVSASSADFGPATNAITSAHDSANVWATGFLGDDWWKIDFGSGNDKNIKQVKLWSECPDAGGSPYMPSQFKLEWSDNDVAWTEAKAWTTTPWTACTERTFDV